MVRRALFRRRGPSGGSLEVGRERAVADLAYALLLIGVFLLLALTVRGLEKL
ncbi:hypothetical protein [Actinokineospora terrae]|uniref:hypothetical protein n=1 Tax=Actinokineospora terrae TaxID=155974 RepID=UPI0015A5CB23|nr:hypothetical protein [Actinokineospora terrae]